MLRAYGYVAPQEPHSNMGPLCDRLEMLHKGETYYRARVKEQQVDDVLAIILGHKAPIRNSKRANSRGDDALAKILA